MKCLNHLTFDLNFILFVISAVVVHGSIIHKTTFQNGFDQWTPQGRHAWPKWPECHNLASYQMFLWIFDKMFWENAKIANFLTENVQIW